MKALLSLAEGSSKCVKISPISSKEFQSRFIHDKIDHLKNRKKPVSGKVFNGSGVTSSVFLVMLNCPPWNTASLKGPAARNIEVFIKEASALVVRLSSQ